MNVSNLFPAVESTNWSILGRGKLSFGQVLFEFMKSTHILHFPFDFFTSTTLASQLGQQISQIKPAYSSLLTSSVIAWFRSGAKTLCLCQTGFFSGSTFSLCWMTFGDMPSMSSGLHAKTSRFSLRNWTSLVLISGLSVILILSSSLPLLQLVPLSLGLPLYLFPSPQSSMYGSPLQPTRPGSILWPGLDPLLPH